MLYTKNLTYAYADGPRLSFPDISLERSGSALLLGPSGSGKSTWLHLLAGILTPATGQTVLGDTDYARLSGGALDRFRGIHIGLVLQRAYFIPSLTVAENLALARQLAGLPPDHDRVIATLERLDVARYADRRPHRLSVGEQQRVTIARALVNAPRLILADEPTSALDRRNAERVSAMLREAAESLGAMLLVVTHDERLSPHFKNQIRIDATANA